MARYGCRVYFEHGKVAEISSDHQEWTDDLRRVIDSQPELLEALEAVVTSPLEMPSATTMDKVRAAIAKARSGA